MSILMAIILGLVQGLTEFLPVSSSGHLAIIQYLFDLEETAPETIMLAFDVMVHFATLLAILIIVFPDIIRILKKDRRMIVLLLIGSIPAGLAGVLLKKHFDVLMNNILVVGGCLLFTALLLYMSRLFGKDKKTAEKMSVLDSLFIGLSQAVAILPGVSRSGSTISTARMAGIDAKGAFSFSFLLGSIAIFGAAILHVPDMGKASESLGLDVLAAAFVAAFVSGLAAGLVLRKIVVSEKLHYFSFYLVPLGAACIGIHFFVN